MSRSRAWCFTINNPVDDTIPQNWDYSYLVYQKEKGDSGTEHLQGYLYLKNAVRFATVKKLDATAHWEPARGTAEENKAYCTKEEGRIAGPWELGTMPKQGKRNDIAELKALLDEGKPLTEIAQIQFGNYLRFSRGIEKYQLLITKPRNWEMVVEVIWGPTGVGKTRQAFEEHPNAYFKSRSNGGNNWWDGYVNQEVVVVDEFYGWFTWDFMLRLCDRYPLSVETKGGAVQFVAKKIIFTSNTHPKEWYKAMTEKYGWDANTNPLCRRISKLIHIEPPAGTPAASGAAAKKSPLVPISLASLYYHPIEDEENKE